MSSYLPISMCPGGSMVVELVFADSAESCCDTTLAHGSFLNVSELVVHVDVLSVRAAMRTNLSHHLYGGNALRMQFENYHTAFFSLLSSDTQLTHSRAASRLNSVRVTFGKPDVASSAKKSQTDLSIPASQKLKARLTVGEKRFPATEDMQGMALFYRASCSPLGIARRLSPAKLTSLGPSLPRSTGIVFQKPSTVE